MKAEDLIPHGYYCYIRLADGTRKICPFWSTIPDLPEQENGYCSFLGKSDRDMNKEDKWIDMKTKEEKTAEEWGLPMSLLWDMVKECQINMPTDEDIENENI